MQLNPSKQLRVMRHLLDVATLNDDPVAQQRLLVDGMNQLIGTDQSFFFFADGFKPGQAKAWQHVTVSTDLDAAARKYLVEFGMKCPQTIEPYCAFSMIDPAELTPCQRARFLPPAAEGAMFKSFSDLDRVLRATDGVVGISCRDAEPAGAVVVLAMHRVSDDPQPLSAVDQNTIDFAVAEIHRMMERGILSGSDSSPDESLPPRLQQVLDLLLAAHTPKAIARRLELSLHTVREHIRRLYKHYNVSGRDELMSYFLTKPILAEKRQWAALSITDR